MASSGGRAAPPCPEELPSAQQRPLPGQLPRRVLWEQAPALLPEPVLAPPQLQPQPQPQPYLAAPPAQQQPARAPSAPAPQINISSETLQQLLLSVSQKSGSSGQPSQQQGNGFQQQVPVQATPQPQQQQQWNVPNSQPRRHGNPPSQQQSKQGTIPVPVSLPAPSNINPQHPRRQQAAPSVSTRQPDQAQQRKPPVTLKPPGQPKLAQPRVLQPPQQQRAPVVLKAPGQPNWAPPAQQHPPGPVVLPRPAQPQYAPPPQAGQQRPAQPAPAYNQHLPQGLLQNPRPPPVQHLPRQVWTDRALPVPAILAVLCSTAWGLYAECIGNAEKQCCLECNPSSVMQGQGNSAQPSRAAPVRPAPLVQLGPTGNAPRPQQGPRGQGRALCTYFNTPRVGHIKLSVTTACPALKFAQQSLLLLDREKCGHICSWIHRPAHPRMCRLDSEL